MKKIQNIIKEDNVCKISLRFLVDLGLVNFPLKFNIKFIFTLERNVNGFFESSAKMDAIQNSVNAEIIFHLAPYILYEQFQLDNNFRTYLKTTLVSNRALRTGTKPIPYQKSYEINTGAQSLVVDFRGANKQFSFLSISLVYDKSDQHNTFYDSYNIEIATKTIKTITMENAANTYSVFDGVKCDLKDEHDKYLLHCQFVFWVCNSCSIARLTDYSNNQVFRELPKKKSTLE